MSEEMRGRGRPPAQDKEVLQAIMADSKKLDDLKNDFKSLQEAVLLKDAATKTLKNRLTYVSESTGLSKSFLTSFIKSLEKQDFEEKLEQAEAAMNLVEEVQLGLV